jgi:hypothetical protein
VHFEWGVAFDSWFAIPRVCRSASGQGGPDLSMCGQQGRCHLILVLYSVIIEMSLFAI